MNPLVARKFISRTSVEHEIREIWDVITRFILTTNHTNVRFVVTNAEEGMLWTDICAFILVSKNFAIWLSVYCVGVDIDEYDSPTQIMRRWLIVSAKPMLQSVYCYVVWILFGGPSNESNSHKKLTKFENVIFLGVKVDQRFFGKYSIVWKK